MFYGFASAMCEFRHPHCDAISRIADASFPIFCAISIHTLGSALRLLRSLTEASMCLRWRCRILRKSLTAAVLCLFPTYVRPFRAKLLFPPCRTKVRVSKYNTMVRAKLRASCCGKCRCSLSLPLRLSRSSYGSLRRTAKSPGRPSGTTCQRGFNSSAQLFPVNGLLLASDGAGT